MLKINIAASPKKNNVATPIDLCRTRRWAGHWLAEYSVEDEARTGVEEVATTAAAGLVRYQPYLLASRG